jgi:hypothetical protein
LSPASKSVSTETLQKLSLLFRGQLFHVPILALGKVLAANGRQAGPAIEMEEQRPKDSWWMSLVAAIAFILWGLYANWHHGWQSRAQVAMTQGIISLGSTYFAAEFIVYSVRKFQDSPFPVISGALASYLVIHALILGGHFVAGTPEFWPTVLPGMTSGMFFCVGYSLRVHKKLNLS